jgi:hypothetical protein
MFNSYHFDVLCKKSDLVGKGLLRGHQLFGLLKAIIGFNEYPKFGHLCHV